LRIEALHLIAYGPFTEKTLDFSFSSATSGDFHLVYGPNEAGKSSALRALRALLYGIPERSPDGFLHPYPRMRVGGTLCSKSGSRLSIVRRKGRARTLRDADDRSVVEESALSALLGGVDADLFSTMYGIGYEDLVAGGREIVSGGGDLGRLIFSAGSGIARLNEVRSSLGAEADALYKPSGKNPAINAALGELRENEKALRAVQLSGSRWAELDAEHKAAAARRDAVEAELSKHEAERSQLARIQEALPLIARRREILSELAAYSDAVRLPEDFPEVRRERSAAIDAARREADRAERSCAALEAQIQELPRFSAILDAAELVEGFHQQLGSQQKAAADRIKLETRRSALLGEAREILRGLSENLSLDNAETLRVKKERAAAIRRLSSEYEQIAARLDHVREAVPGLRDEIERLRERRSRIPKLKDPEGLNELRAALAEAADYAPLEKQNQKTAAELELQEKSLASRLERLGLSGADSQALERLAAPSLETIHSYESRLDAAERKIAELASQQEAAEEETRRLQARIRAGQMAQAVPSENDLESARAARDTGWQLIREKLAGSEPDAAAVDRYLALAPEAEGIAHVFEQQMADADALADRLRREADRVAEHARLTADHAAAEARKKEAAKALETAREERGALLQAWQEAWQPVGVPAGSPREMERWVREMNDAKEALAAHEENLGRVRDLAGTISEQKEMLAGRMAALENQSPAVSPPDPPLARLIRRARDFLDAEQSRKTEAEQLDAEIAARRRELSGLQARQTAAETDLSRWRREWEAAVAPLGLSAEALPQEAAEVLEEVRSLFEKLKEADVLLQRIRGIDRDSEEFSRGVADLAAAVSPDLCEKPARDIAVSLHQRLTRAREAQTRRTELEKQLENERENLAKARREAEEIDARLARMCEEAGCASIRDLPEAEERSRRRGELEAARKTVEERILSFSAGDTVEAFVQAAAEVDPDSIGPELERLGEAIAALAAEKNELAERIGSLRNELGRMDGSAAAAELAEKRQAILGRLDPQVRRYARTRLAAHILDRAIERFRDKNQGPMLTRAASLFSEITCGAFSGVRAEIDENGRPVITGVRAGSGEAVPVSGMSDGTADQLYLALRLAGLETAIRKAEPLPFIVDDILVQFDNDRAAAALEALVDLSSRTQVIFFTHHHHLAELARTRLSENAPVFHEL
jgi:uncharacterized protein YhaN